MTSTASHQAYRDVSETWHLPKQRMDPSLETMMRSKRGRTLTSQYEPGIAVLSNLSNDIYWLKNVTKIEGIPWICLNILTHIPIQLSISNSNLFQEIEPTSAGDAMSMGFLAGWPHWPTSLAPHISNWPPSLRSCDQKHVAKLWHVGSS